MVLTFQWASGSLSLDTHCPYSGARPLRHHVGKSVTASAVASEKEDETRDCENFLKNYFHCSIKKTEKYEPNKCIV